MTKPRYRPTPQGLPFRLLAYFTTNQVEELTVKDACTKFSCKQANLSMAVRALERAGYVERVNVIRLRPGKDKRSSK